MLMPEIVGTSRTTELSKEDEVSFAPKVRLCMSGLMPLSGATVRTVGVQQQQQTGMQLLGTSFRRAIKIRFVGTSSLRV